MGVLPQLDIFFVFGVTRDKKFWVIVYNLGVVAYFHFSDICIG